MINFKTATATEVAAFIADALGGEMIAAYNAHADKPVTRFASRTVAIERVTKLAASLRGEAEEPKEQTEVKKEAKVKEPKPAKETKAKEPKPAKEPKAPKVAADPADVAVRRAASISESWKNPEVAAKRAERHAVRVNGAEYRSVTQAFAALNLPMSKVVKFRMALKAAGSLNEFGHKWVVIEA